MNSNTLSSDESPASALQQVLEGVLTQWPGKLPADRDQEYRTLIAQVAALADTADPWHQLPDLIAGIFGERGWSWNGIYARAESQLLLVASHGPPVCNTLELHSRVGSGGMCCDAILLNRCVFAADVSSYPGYVSCDGESGLATCAGLVCPIRNGDGTAIAVWDLDSTKPLKKNDVLFFDALFGTLSAYWRPRSLFERSPIGAASTPSLGHSSSLATPRSSDNIRLAQFMKWKGMVGTGGAAKMLIQDGKVQVNGEVEVRRGRRLRSGDVVEAEGASLTVE